MAPTIMFIGEAPGRSEDEQGRPFVGYAGKVLDAMLYSINLDRLSVCIYNIVMCRPPENRVPTSTEINICTILWLKESIALIKPHIVVPLGNTAWKWVYDNFVPDTEYETISRVHGKVIELDYVTIIPAYHPAATIYNKDLRQSMLDDFKVIRNELGRNPWLIKYGGGLTEDEA